MRDTELICERNGTHCFYLSFYFYGLDYQRVKTFVFTIPRLQHEVYVHYLYA